MYTVPPRLLPATRAPRGTRPAPPLRALRLLPAGVPDLPGDRQRARRPARPHLPDQGAGRGRRASARRRATHLDRCLTCRACETACPSGVQYGRLVDLGRELVEARPPAPRARCASGCCARRCSRWRRDGRSSRRSCASRRRCARLFPRAAMRSCRRRATARTDGGTAVRSPVTSAAWSCSRVACSRGSPRNQCRGRARTGPARHLARGRARDRLLWRDGASPRALEPRSTRCAATSRPAPARLDDGAEAIVSTASGCGVFAKDYGHVLRHDDRRTPPRRRSRRRGDPRPVRGDRRRQTSPGSTRRASRAARGSASPGRRPARSSTASALRGGQGRGDPAGRRLRTRAAS